MFWRRSISQCITLLKLSSEQTSKTRKAPIDLITQPPKVRAGDRPIIFGPSRIPNLDLDDSIVHLDLFGAELYPDRGVQHRVEFFFDKLAHKAGLPDVGVSEEDKFEQEVVVGHCIDSIMHYFTSVSEFDVPLPEPISAAPFLPRGSVPQIRPVPGLLG